MLGEAGTSDLRFEPIQGARAAEHNELVSREDVQGNLHAALRKIVDGKAKTVVELGAGAEALLDETPWLLKPGGTVIIIETHGTDARVPATLGPILLLFYAWLKEEKGFARRWIRADYRL